jgi:ribosomal protein L40E
MALCPKCGSDNEEGAKFCSECGTPLLTAKAPEPEAPEPSAPELNAQQPVYTAPENPYGAAQYTAPTPQPIGGLLAWSIISILLCLIPGIVALIQTLSINSAPTGEEQLRKLSTAKTWCIIATILGVIKFLIFFISIVFYHADYSSQLIG